MKTPKLPRENRRLYSKLREFWILHPGLLVGIACAFFFAIALALFFIVCDLKEWDVGVVLTSPKAILIYAIGLVVGVILLCRNVIFKRW